MIFTIKNGSHYSNQFWYKLLNFFNFKSNLTYEVIFNVTSIYKFPNVDQQDINKLFGYSNGMHHNNSSRFGWNYDGQDLILWAYYYNSGQLKYKQLTKIEFGETYQLSIYNENSACNFIVRKNNKLAVTLIVDSNSNSIGYKLWPYFGGNNVDPHDITIEMSKV